MQPRILRACKQLPTDCTPVWFMRQAGRYMPEYRSLRKSHSILEICKTPQLAAEVTLQPIKAFNVDAAIIFADLLLPLEAMGLRIEFISGYGPYVYHPIRSPKDVAQLITRHVSDLDYVGESIKLVQEELDGRIPLIGFVGAPFTMASYMIEGAASRNYMATKSLMWSEPETWKTLMEKLVDVLAGFASLQVSAGADIIQVFDSWVGNLAPTDYERYVLPYSKQLIRRIQDTSVPVIHFGTGNGSFLETFCKAGGEVIGLDWRVEIASSWNRAGRFVAVQGNLDPIALLAPLPELKSRVYNILNSVAGRTGHIFNLGHGIIPETPMNNVKAVVEMVHEYNWVFSE